MKTVFKTSGLYVSALLLLTPLYACCWWMMLKEVVDLSVAYESAGVTRLPACLSFAIVSWHDIHYKPWVFTLVLLSAVLFEWKWKSGKKDLIRQRLVYVLTLLAMCYLSLVALSVATGAYFYVAKLDQIIEQEVRLDKRDARIDSARPNRTRPELRTVVRESTNSNRQVEMICLGDVPLFTSIRSNHIEILRGFALDGGRSICEQDHDGDGVFEDVRVWQDADVLYSVFRRHSDGKITHLSPEEVDALQVQVADYLDMHKAFMKTMRDYLK